MDDAIMYAVYSGKFSKQQLLMYLEILSQLWKFIPWNFWTYDLFMCSNQLFHMLCGNNYVVVQVVAKDEVPHPTWPLYLWLSSLAIVAASEESTKVMDSEKEKTIKTIRGEYVKYL